MKLFFSIIFILLSNFSWCQTDEQNINTSKIESDSCINGIKLSFTHANTLYTLSHKKDSITINYIFYPNGSVRELYYFSNEVIVRKVGWYKNGVKSYEYFYLKGKVAGEVKRYFETGSIKCIQYYKNGFVNGKEIWYKTNGKIDKVLYYKMGDEVNK